MAALRGQRPAGRTADIGAARIALFMTFELKTLDARFQLRGGRSATSPLAVVFIRDAGLLPVMDRVVVT
jgi:hypothetical protein